MINYILYIKLLSLESWNCELYLNFFSVCKSLHCLADIMKGCSDIIVLGTPYLCEDMSKGFVSQNQRVC